MGMIGRRTDPAIRSTSSQPAQQWLPGRPRRMHTKSWAGRGLLRLLGHLPRVLSPPGWALYGFNSEILYIFHKIFFFPTF